MKARHANALRRAYEADRSQTAKGREPEQFHLRHSGGMQSHIEHPGWDPSWAIPSEHTIDDLEEMDYLRVDPHHNKQRSFSLTLKGREAGEQLAANTQSSAQDAPALGIGGSFTEEERRSYAKQADAELDLAITSFLGRRGNESFTVDELADAVSMPKFDVVAAVQWLRAAEAEGKVSPVGGGWRVNTDGPTYHVRILPSKAQDRMSGPLYAFDLTEEQLLHEFVGPYQRGAQIVFAGRTLTAYRKPKIGRLYAPGAKTLDSIRNSLAASAPIHSQNEAEELFFEKTVQDITDSYIDDSEPASVSAEDPSANPESQPRDVFIVHGHSHEDKVARAVFEITGRQPVLLAEQPGRGQTIIEKFERHAGKAGFAVVLLTADDVGAAKDQTEHLTPRARQNAILELGYFLAKVGRENIAVLYEANVELPSDYTGVEYISLSDEWRWKLSRELKAAGFNVSAPNA